MSIFGRRPDPEAVATQLIEGLENGTLVLDETTASFAPAESVAEESLPKGAMVTVGPESPKATILVSSNHHVYRITNHGPGAVKVSFDVPNRNGESLLPPGASIDLEATRIEVTGKSPSLETANVGYELLKPSDSSAALALQSEPRQ